MAQQNPRFTFGEKIHFVLGLLKRDIAPFTQALKCLIINKDNAKRVNIVIDRFG